MDKPMKIFFTVLMIVFVVLGLVSMWLYIDQTNVMQLALFAGIVSLSIVLTLMSFWLVWD